MPLVSLTPVAIIYIQQQKTDPGPIITQEKSVEITTAAKKMSTRYTFVKTLTKAQRVQRWVVFSPPPTQTFAQPSKQHRASPTQSTSG